MELKCESKEVIPDSEEERIRQSAAQTMEIIEIFSSDEDETASQDCSRVKGSKAILNTPAPDNAHSSVRKSRLGGSRLRFISQNYDSDVIELSDSSSESVSAVLRTIGVGKTSNVGSHLSQSNSFRADDEDDEPWNINDGSILILDEPRSARKPIRGPRTASCDLIIVKDSPVSQRAPLSSIEFFTDSNHESPSRSPKTPARSPRKKGAPSTVAKTPRVTKRSKQAEEQARRAKYAEQLFIDLNRGIFQNGLPQDTKLTWSSRLLTTAGRAKWHRNHGIDNSEIELATKILDCDERIRNTLSHEMCHLACWIINRNSKESHGGDFKAWAAKVMREHPEIEITTKHHYDISYPYEWKCEQCARIYGRFSKSIRPDECFCGACKVGKLIPLFSQRVTTKPKTPKISNMAAAVTQGSPCSKPQPVMPGSWPGLAVKTISETSIRERPAVFDMNGLSEDETDTILAKALSRVEIGGI